MVKVNFEHFQQLTTHLLVATSVFRKVLEVLPYFPLLVGKASYMLHIFRKLVCKPMVLIH